MASTTSKDYNLLIARILIILIFIAAAIGKIMNPAGTMAFMSSMGMPATGFFLVIAILFEVIGSLSVLLGFKTKLGAIILIIFLIPTTLIFHTNFADQMQMAQFFKNLAIIAGLLALTVTGPGRISVDRA